MKEEIWYNYFVDYINIYDGIYLQFLGKYTREEMVNTGWVYICDL